MARLPIVSNHVAARPKEPLPLPVARQLAKLWAEVEALPMWLPTNAWRRWRVQRRLRLRQLEPAALTVAAPVGKANDCLGCSESCCIGPEQSVLLRLKDIGNLMDLGRTDLLQKDKPRFSRAALKGRPARKHHVASLAWQIFPVLKQNDFGACRALTAEGLCSLYPHWPLSCARFPYAIDLAAAELFYSSRCRSFFIHPVNATFVQQMAAKAVAGYNERIKDALLLEFRRDALRDLGLLQHLSLPAQT